MKKILFIVFIFTYCFALSQNDNLKHRIEFTADSEYSNSQTNKVVLSNKVLYAKTREPYLFNDSIFKLKKTLRLYKSLVFRHKDELLLKQWNTPIIIYFDKKIPKTVIENFSQFYSQLNNIKNLNISFTKNIEKANYYIQSTNKNINAYPDTYTFKSEEERINSILTGATYSLITDKNNKFYAGILTINISNKDDLAILKQLKQLFYMGLGNFYSSKKFDRDSLLSDKYEKVDYISNFDLTLLKMHYINIYDQKITREIFNNLIKSFN
jgi:hypothetical protein